MEDTGKRILVGIAGAVVAVEIGTLLYRMIRRMMQDSEATNAADAPQQRTLRLAVSRPPLERVDAASEDSFPASDPPSWTGSGL